MLHVIINWVSRGGELLPATKADEVKLRLFKSGLPEGQRVEGFLCRQNGEDDDSGLAQKAKVHAMIRDIATASGQTFKSTKMEVKERAGLIELDETGSERLKSFGDCSRAELSHAIEVCYEISAMLGLRF